MNLSDWLPLHLPPAATLYAKRLSNNDTLANGSHQAGPYIPREIMFSVFPSLNRPYYPNPDTWFELRVDSHPDVRQVRAIWYNNKFHGGTRNETRFTNFSGEASALLDPDNTGALTIFAFHRDGQGDAFVCHVWVCRNVSEESTVEAVIGPVYAGQ